MEKQFSTLSIEDRDLINGWSQKFKIEIWFWSIFLIPMFIFTTWLISLLNGDVLFVIVFIVGLDLLSLGRLANRIYGLMNVKKCLRKNEKYIVAGDMKSLEVKKQKWLIYTIGKDTVTVLDPLLPVTMLHSYVLNGWKVRLHAVSITPSIQLLLQVEYDKIAPPKKENQPITAEDKSHYNSKKDSWDAIKITGGLMGAMCLLTCLFVPGRTIWLFVIIYLACFLLIGGVVFFVWWAADRRTNKIILTGTVTEVFRIRYKIGRYSSYKEMNWYRLGNETVAGTMIDKDGVFLGSTARFVFYADKKGRRGALMGVTCLNHKTTTFHK